MSAEDRWFHPLSTRQSNHPLAAFDVMGGGGLNGFACGCLVTEKRTRFYTDRAEMLADIRGLVHRRAWPFCHGLQYDLPLLEGEAFPQGKMLFTRYNLLWSTYRIHDRRFRIYDSLNLFPHLTSRDLGEMVGIFQAPLSDQLKRQLSEGRPWSFFTPLEQEAIQAYTVREAEILFAALTSFQEVVLSLGGTLRPTISGCAMDIFRRRFMLWPWPVVGPATNHLARPAYYGGRVENFAYGKVPHVNLYDVNSLYPYVQSQTLFPHPRYLRLEWQPKISGDWQRWEGVVECEIWVPDRFVPPLPFRYDKRLFFPFGRLRGSWPIAEVRHAIETGCQLRSVEWALGSPITFNPFTKFMETLYHERVELRSAQDGRHKLVKLLMNSLYGRWGLNPEGGLYSLRQLDTPGEVDLEDGTETLVTPFGLYAYEPIRDVRQPEYVNVLFAAQISGAARLHLLNELEWQNENLAYCDTDSIITRGTLHPGESLGDWRQELENGTADLVSPKDYSLQPLGGLASFTTKGVPAEVSQEYFQKGIARFRRALGIREALRQGKQPSEWVQTFKARGVHLAKRQPLDPALTLTGTWVSTAPYSTAQLQDVTVGRFLPADWEEFFQVPLLPEAPQPAQLDFQLP